MKFSRRDLLKNALGLAAASQFSQVSAAGASPILVAGRDRADGQHTLGWVCADGRAAQLDLPFRGHGLTRLDGARVILFARRPGTQAAVVDLASGQLQRIFDAGEQRHFYGHGTLSADGQKLFTSEQDMRTGEGVIGIRDTESFEKIGEFPAHGIGPHDLRLVGSDTLLVAVGGILTRGRDKLNIATMRPSLNWIDANSGKLLAKHELAEHQLSTRHLAIGAGHYAVACQWEGEGVSPALLALGKLGEAPALLPMDAAQRAMRGYAASVCIDAGARRVAMSSPRGGVLGLWDLHSRELIAAPRLPDVCGLAQADSLGFVTTCGSGAAYVIAPHDGAVRELAGTFEGGDYWDNHALLV